MDKLYYIAFTEYDMNHEGLVFKSHTDAYEFGEKQFNDMSDGRESWDDYVNAGYFEVKEVQVYESE